MDIDVLRVSGETEWKRLEQLTRQRSLSGDEIDEFDRLYVRPQRIWRACARTTPIPT